MKPLSTTQQILNWLLICPTDKPMGKGKKIISILLVATIISTVAFYLCASLVALLKYASTDLERAIFALFQVSATSSAAYTIIVTIFQRYKIAAIFDGLSKLYFARENQSIVIECKRRHKHQLLIEICIYCWISDEEKKELYRFLVLANNKSEVIWVWYFKYAIIATVLAASLFISSIAFCLFKYGYLDVGHLYHMHELV